MKQYFCIAATLFLLQCGCTQKAPAVPYEILSDTNGLYAYRIYDKSNQVLLSADSLTQEPTISQITSTVFRIQTSAGPQMSTKFTQYCDVSNGNISDIFDYVLCEYHTLTVYAENVADQYRIIVQDVFSSETPKCIALPEDLSPVAEPVTDAEFSDNGEILTVTYLCGNEYKTVSQSFMIQNEK